MRPLEINSSERPHLSKNNHFRFGYNHGVYNQRLTNDDKWWADYGASLSTPLSFREECVRTAREIYDNAKTSIAVLFSGGIDSEVALQSFYYAQVPVRAAILKFKNGLNDHDTGYAIRCCEELSIPYTLFEIDVLSFWENELWNYAKPTNCVSPQFLTTMWLSDQLDEFPVIGSGDCNFIKSSSPGHDIWELWEKEKVASWYRHFQIQNRPACPAFFQYTPEIINSFVNDPFVNNIFSNRIPTYRSISEHKLTIYQNHFKLLNRPKYTGFEKIMEHDQYFRNQLEREFPSSNSVFKTSLKDLKQKLQGQLIWNQAEWT